VVALKLDSAADILKSAQDLLRSLAQ